jgi:hypothetical protein
VIVIVIVVIGIVIVIRFIVIVSCGKMNETFDYNLQHRYVGSVSTSMLKLAPPSFLMQLEYWIKIWNVIQQVEARRISSGSIMDESVPFQLFQWIGMELELESFNCCSLGQRSGLVYNGKSG